MRFTYNNNEYELMEIKEPNKNESFDMIGIFRVKWVDIACGEEEVEVPKEVYLDAEYGVIEKYEFINYFYGADDEDEELIEMAKEYIDSKSSN